MKSRTTQRFRELLAKLPQEVQQQADAAYRLFVTNPRHPSLRFKRIHPLPPIYSARVGIGYRAVGVMEGDTIAWYWIGTHAEYDQLLKQL
jgi:hypothetical protein